MNKIATTIITNKISPEYEKEFLLWNAKISQMESKFPGFIGYKLEKSTTESNNWITIISFDNKNNLQNWLDSTERSRLLDEAKSFTTGEHLHTIVSGFNFWFDICKNQQAVWKENMLVLLGLYPIVFLYAIFVDRPYLSKILPQWFAIFLGCIISVLILSRLFVPFLFNKFKWWLLPEHKNYKNTFLGILIVSICYATLMLFFSFLV